MFTCMHKPNITATVFFFFSAGTLVCTLKDVLIFFTGSDSIPPFGKVDFEASKLPQSSTCDYLLRIPTEHSDYESLKEFFQLGVLGHDGFGVI